MLPRLPSRYEDLDDAFKGRLRPSETLLALVKQAFSGMQVSGGIRFLPIFGESGSGKTSAAMEIGNHLPEVKVIELSRDAVTSPEHLLAELKPELRPDNKLLVAIVDQYEENVAKKEAIPTSFVEQLALLDRGELRREKILFIWLTTDRAFQKSLADATSRNRRILVSSNFELEGPQTNEWPSIVEETFRFHNQERDLADYHILDVDIQEVAAQTPTLGTTIEKVGMKLQDSTHTLQDLSSYQVVMLWPVTDGTRIGRIQQFTDARQGYKLDWNAWYRQLNPEDQRQLPMREFNRTRLYFDLRLVPIAAADLHPLCRDLDDDNIRLHKTYLERLQNTHFFSIVAGTWNAAAYSPLRERESKRAAVALEWYRTVTNQPTKLGRRLARCLSELGINAGYEQEIRSPHSKVRADVLIERTPINPPNVIVEIKAFSPENTMPSSICDAVKTTLKRHAQFAGILARQ